MFTGLIRELAEVVSFQGDKLTIRSKYTPKIGDSIAINGACLTVTCVKADTFTVELSHESKKILAYENYKGKVHMEPAMTLSDRLEGHIVQGHVDCVGKITSITKTTNSWDFHITVSKDYMKFVVPKGSITVDGVSLTVNEVRENNFRLTLIPHSLENTLFLHYKQGDRVNIETDMFARYIYYMFKKKKELSWEEIDKINFLY